MAKEKARIQKELLEKKMAVDVAELHSRRSQSSASSYKSKVENWLEKSIAEHGPPLDGDNKVTVGDTGASTAIQELICAIKSAVEASTASQNGRTLLTRLATSKDLPQYYGDP